MTTLFTLLDNIMTASPFGDEKTVARLNDIDGLVRYAESVDAEIDSDQAIQIQQVGLNWITQVEKGADQAQCRHEAQVSLDGE